MEGQPYRGITGDRIIAGSITADRIYMSSETFEIRGDDGVILAYTNTGERLPMNDTHLAFADAPLPQVTRPKETRVSVDYRVSPNSPLSSKSEQGVGVYAKENDTRSLTVHLGGGKTKTYAAGVWVTFEEEVGIDMHG
jgi:hypothetical protein